MLRSVLVASGLLLSGVAGACMWDYDTFAVEAAGKNDLVAVLAGRFERNPPLYYQMRLDRCLKDLKTTPGNLDLYDNAAVAAERLGHHDQALKIIAEKRNNLKPLPQDKDHWYRYYANLGTFHAHRSFAQKNNKSQLADLAAAEKEIAEAIKINPESHFGREKYQLYAIRWLKGVRLGKKDSYYDVLYDADHLDKNGPDAAIKGLAGLIRLGGAWESVDVWSTLGSLLSLKDDSSLAQFAYARTTELYKEGKRSMVGLSLDDLTTSYEGAPADDIEKVNKIEFRNLRRQADLWHKNRTEYILERLKQGKHPDWDKTFWSTWNDEPKLEIPSPTLSDRLSVETKLLLALAGFLVFLVFVPTVSVLWVLRRRRRLASLKR